MSSDGNVTSHQRLRRIRNGVLVLTVLGVAVVAWVGIRHEAPPEQVVRDYVQATLSAHDDRAAATLTCRAPQLDSIRQWQQDLAAGRQRFNLPPLTADVAAYDETRSRDKVTATADVSVTLAIDGQRQQRLTRPFTFQLTHEQSWKVCTAVTES